MKKILIIEDDPIVGHIYRTRLEKECYHVDTAVDGQSGFYKIQEFHPDAVILDLMLPKMNGVDILKKIRALDEFQKVPIIVFTNAYVPNMIQESFNAGATQVFNKATLTPRQILDALHNALFPTAEGSAPESPSTPRTGPSQAQTPTGASPVQDRDVPGAIGQTSSPNGAARSAHSDPPYSVTALQPGRTAELIASGTELNSDSEAQEELRETFKTTAPETFTVIRKLMQEFSKAQDDASRVPHLQELYRKVHALTGSAGIAGLHNISQTAAALEVLLKELSDKPKNINASTLRTVAHSIDFIAELFNNGTGCVSVDPTPINILVVDDEILSRRAITYALEKASLKTVSVEDPQVALKLASENDFDLIFLDVQMPGMDGFELCTKIRAIPTHKKTPIIFVTSLTDFKSRARSSLSGGTDLIAKPFMFIELSVKAITYVLRGRLARKELAAVVASPA